MPWILLETGGVSLVSDVTDWPSEQACIQVVQNIYSLPPTAQVIGSSITIKMSASCVPVTPNIEASR